MSVCKYYSTITLQIRVKFNFTVWTNIYYSRDPFLSKIYTRAELNKKKKTIIRNYNKYNSQIPAFLIHNKPISVRM